MEKVFRPLLAFLFLSLTACMGHDRQANTTAIPVPVADPYILYEDGTYYLYGTGNANGIAVYTSDDLRHWRVPERAENVHLALYKSQSYGDKWFWAPEVYHIGDTYYMYYSAEEHICVATATSPLGPFRQGFQTPMVPYKAIDNSLFIDEDGKPWLFFVRFNEGNQVWVAELEDNYTTVKTGTERQCLQMDQAWETVWPTVNEGPFVLKHDGQYYLTYSANSYESPKYGIGYATAPSPTGPWTKYDHNPVYQCVGGLEGVGHHSFFRDAEGVDRIVFHSHNAPGKIHPRVVHISTYRFNADGTLVISPDFFTPHLYRP